MATGPDNTPQEALNQAKEINTEVLHIVFKVKDIWEKDDIPNDWREGYIVKIKKGDLASARIIEESPYCQFQAKYSTGSY